MAVAALLNDSADPPTEKDIHEPVMRAAQHQGAPEHHRHHPRRASLGSAEPLGVPAARRVRDGGAAASVTAQAPRY